MSMSARFIPTVLTLVLGCSFGVERAGAQAMVSYGHGVAKAAGAGAAVGAGVGGALTGLGNPLSTAAGRRGGSSKRNAVVQRQTVPTRRGSVAWNIPQQGFGGAAPMTLIGGVRANGATQANRQLTLLEPSQNLAVISASWGGPSTAGSEDSDEVIATEQQPTDTQADTQAETTAEAKPNLPIILRSTGQRSLTAGKSAQPSDAVAPAALPEGVAVGASVEELLEKLGRPYLSFRGVAGEGYTDQYVFQLPDGAHLVVYVLDGAVAHMTLG